MKAPFSKLWRNNRQRKFSIHSVQNSIYSRVIHKFWPNVNQLWDNYVTVGYTISENVRTFSHGFWFYLRITVRMWCSYQFGFLLSNLKLMMSQTGLLFKRFEQITSKTNFSPQKFCCCWFWTFCYCLLLTCFFRQFYRIFCKMTFWRTAASKLSLKL